MDEQEQDDGSRPGDSPDQGPVSWRMRRERWPTPTVHAGEVQRLLSLRWRYRTGQLTEWGAATPPPLPDDLWTRG